MQFKHFTKNSVDFLTDLSNNNNKEWFNANRSRYDNFLLAEAKDFTEEIGKRLLKINPNLTYSPKVDSSIFRIYKDARHNTGAPFKTHLGIIFWEGEGRLDSPCFYFHIEPPFYAVGAGLARVTPPILTEYRKNLQDKKYGHEFAQLIQKIMQEGYSIFGKKRKNLPKGVKSGTENEEFLKYDLFSLNDETPINESFYSDEFIENIMEIYKNLAPFHKWLVDLINRAKLAPAK